MQPLRSLLAHGAQLSERNSELDISPFVKKVWKAVTHLSWKVLGRLMAICSLGNWTHWELSVADVWVKTEVSGILRVLGAGDPRDSGSSRLGRQPGTENKFFPVHF